MFVLAEQTSPNIGFSMGGGGLSVAASLIFVDIIAEREEKETFPIVAKGCPSPEIN